MTAARLLPPTWRCLAAVMAMIAATSKPLAATCNVIPGTTNTFRGARGSIDRPFAGPGDVLTLRLSPVCDDDGPALGADVGELVVTFVFAPPAGPRNVVAVAADCGALGERLARCRERADIDTAICVLARTNSGDGGGVDLSLGKDTRGARLDVRLPDTDDTLPPADDGHGFTGPATVAVSAAGDELPCELAALPCRQRPGLVACVDELFRINSTCDQAPHELFSHFTALPAANDYGALCSDGPGCSGEAAELRFTVDAGGNVLAPIHWSDVLVADKIDLARLVRASLALGAFPDRPDLLRVPGRSFLHAYSPEGSLLPPLFEPQHDPTAPQGVTLFGTADADSGVLRIDRRSASFGACAGGPNDALPCNGLPDCPDGTCATAACSGGSRAGESCSGDGECPEGECGASLFDFGSRLAGGVGPVVVTRDGPGTCERSGTVCRSAADCAADDRCTRFTLRAQNPVALDGLFESDTVLVSVVPEALANEDLDGDGDRSDDVLLLTDRISGVRLAIGPGDGVPGRAVARINTPPFSFPAVVVADDLIAFLEPEPQAGGIDLNGDGDAVDTILRVFRRTAGGIVDLTADLTLTADAAPVIDGESLAIVDGRVIFRTAEAAAAPRRLRRVSVASDGSEANGASAAPALSADGRQVAFESAATNLAAGDAHGVFVHALDSGDTVAVPLLDPRHDGGWEGVRVPPGSIAKSPSLSGDGRYVAVSAPDELGRSQIWVTDRDADGNGVFDEPGGLSTAIVSTDVRGRQPGAGDSSFPSLTPDGRLLTFLSAAPNLKVNGARTLQNMWQHWDPDTDSILKSEPVENSGVLANTDSLRQPGPIAPNGEIAFASPANNLVANDTNNFCLNPGGNTQCADVFVYSTIRVPYRLPSDDYERYQGVAFERVSVGTEGQEANQQSFAPAISSDGRFVGFISVASNLVPGDDNGVADVFLRDRRRRTTTRLSVAAEHSEADGASFDSVLALSADGRYVAFTSTATNLAAGDTLCDADGDGEAREPCSNVFLHDRFTGFTQRLSAGLGGVAADGPSRAPAMSADGLTVAFRSEAANLVSDDTNNVCTRGGRPINCGDIFVSEPDPTALADDPALDLDGDGDLDDTVLRAFDPTARTTVTIGRASAAASTGDGLAYLSPECNGGPRACRDGSDLNGDGDMDDAVAFWWRPGTEARNLLQDGQEIAASDRWVAVVTARPRTSPVPQDGPYTSLNVHRIGDADGEWTHVDRDAEDIRVAGGIVAFTEGEYNPNALTGAHGFDSRDRVMRVYDADQGMLRSGLEGALAFEAGYFAVSPSLLAFSQREASTTQAAAFPACDSNRDGDCVDRVLKVYDLASNEVLDTGQAVTPCPVAACKPRRPFQVRNDTVTFLTMERDQGEDLNQDGDEGDLILQTFNARAAVAAQSGRGASQRAAGAEQTPPMVTVIGAVAAGVCTTSGAPCVSAEECGPGGECYLPPGGCIADLAATCNFLDPAATNHGCPTGAFCEPTRFGQGICRIRQGPCSADAECRAPARCSDAGMALQRLVAPLTGTADGAQLFVGAGRCVEDLGTPCSAAGSECAGGLSCEPSNATSGARTCQRRQGTCRSDTDCAAGATCRKAAIVAGAADSDGDEIADPYDNCPLQPNVDQQDTTASGVGDACRGGLASPSPTPFPTVTRTPSAITTVTAAPTATATITTAPSATATAPLPTATPTRHRDDGGGCSLAPASRGTRSSNVQPLLAGLAFAVLVRWRRRRR